MRIASAVVVSALASTLALGCARAAKEGDLENLGYSDASSEPPPGVLDAVGPTDLVAMTERGQRVARMERALRLAYEQGLARVGDDGDVSLPLVDVDPGGKSAQVVFVRWEGDAGKDLEVDEAKRWVLVSILLDPDRVLDVELTDGPVEPGSHLARRIRTLLAAARHLSVSAPGQMFHLLDVYERPVGDTKAKPAGRVYALSADGDGPDVELVVEPVKKKGDPAVREATVVHPPGKGVAAPIVVGGKAPTPTTVARALLAGPAAGEVIVMTADDASWTISGADGHITPPAAP